MAESSEISVDHGPAVLAPLPRSRRLRRTARHVETPGIIAPRKVVAEVDRVAVVRLMAVVAVLPTAVAAVAVVEPTAAATADSQPITIFPRPGRVSLPTGPIFIFAREAALAAGNDFGTTDFGTTGISVLRF